MQELKGRVAVVTGAASGIGKGLATRFCDEGMRVVLADVEEATLDKTVAALRQRGGEVHGVYTDVSIRADVENLAARALGHFGAVHVICNNAGVSSGAPLPDVPAEVWSWVMGVNFYGVLHGCQVFLPLLLAQGEGHIVNTSSVAALYGEAPTTGPYVASKAAVLGLSETLYQELSQEPVGVSVLLPGPVRTNIPTSDRNRPAGVPSLRDHPSQAKLQEFFETVMTSWLEPADVADSVVAGIRERRLYLVTHPGRTVEVLRARLEHMGLFDVVAGGG